MGRSGSKRGAGHLAAHGARNSDQCWRRDLVGSGLSEIFRRNSGSARLCNSGSGRCCDGCACICGRLSSDAEAADPGLGKATVSTLPVPEHVRTGCRACPWRNPVATRHSPLGLTPFGCLDFLKVVQSMRACILSLLFSSRLCLQAIVYSKHSLFHAFRATWPVMFGYIPWGLAFGVLFSQHGHAWHYATLMAITIYAGAAQFLAVGLLASGAGPLEIGIATLLLIARHFFYGLSLAPRFPKSGLPRLYLMVGLTDETYALLTSSNPPSPENATRFYVQVTALNQLYWVIGCTLGALLGAAFPLQADGLDFTL